MKIKIPARGPIHQEFANLSLEEAAAQGLKAALASEIAQIIATRRISQSAVADLTGIAQPRVSRIVRGLVDEFSAEKLAHVLLVLGQDIEISVQPSGSQALAGRMQVVTPRGRAEVSDPDAPRKAEAIKTRRTTDRAVDDAALDRARRLLATLPASAQKTLMPQSRDWSAVTNEDLLEMAEQRPLRHLAVEFAVSDVAILQRLRSLGWVSPRARSRSS